MTHASSLQNDAQDSPEERFPDEAEIKQLLEDGKFDQVAMSITTDTKRLSDRFVRMVYDVFIQKTMLLDVVYMYQGPKVLPTVDQLKAILMTVTDDQKRAAPTLKKVHLLEIAYTAYAIALMHRRRDLFTRIADVCGIQFSPTAVFKLYEIDKDEERKKRNQETLKQVLDVTQIAVKLSEALHDSNNDMLLALQGVLHRGVSSYEIACFYLLHQSNCPFEVGDCTAVSVEVKLKGTKSFTLLSAEEQIIIDDEDVLQ